MKLYYHPNSQPSRTSLAVAKHLGLDIELETVDLMAGVQRSEDYLAINPNGKVPALTDGDLKLWESAAIQEYMAARAGNDELRPSDPAAWAAVSKWRHWADTTWNRPCAGLTWNRVWKKFMGRGEPDEAVIEQSLTDFHAAAKILDGHLSGRRWVCGETMTLADFSLASMLTYWQHAEIPVVEYPEIRRWYGQVEELPCWQETVPPMPS